MSPLWPKRSGPSGTVRCPARRRATHGRRMPVQHRDQRPAGARGASNVSTCDRFPPVPSRRPRCASSQPACSRSGLVIASSPPPPPPPAASRRRSKPRARPVPDRRWRCGRPVRAAPPSGRPRSRRPDRGAAPAGRAGGSRAAAIPPSRPAPACGRRHDASGSRVRPRAPARSSRAGRRRSRSAAC